VTSHAESRFASRDGFYCERSAVLTLSNETAIRGIQLRSDRAQLSCSATFAYPTEVKGKRIMAMKHTDTHPIRSPIATSGAEWFEPEPGVRFKVLASTEQTAGAYACLENIAQKGTGSPLHIHHNEDEHFLILEGTAHLVLGEKTIDLPAGQTITLPRGIPHAWSNKSDVPLRSLVMFNPGGFDQLCIEMATGALDMSDIRTRFGIEMVGPKL
jgi:mannose-6-phosphate isomerase-like protein (cupin superfamily)